jgi:hypothetical protein
MVASFTANRVVSAIGWQRGGIVAAADHKRGRLWQWCKTGLRGHRATHNVRAMSALICRRLPRHDIRQPTSASQSQRHERLE